MPRAHAVNTWGAASDTPAPSLSTASCTRSAHTERGTCGHATPTVEQAPDVCSALSHSHSFGCDGHLLNEGQHTCDRPLQMLWEMLAIEATVAPTAAARTSGSASLNAAERSCRMMSVPGRLPSLPSQDAVRVTRSKVSNMWPPPLAIDGKPCIPYRAVAYCAHYLNTHVRLLSKSANPTWMQLAPHDVACTSGQYCLKIGQDYPP